MSAKRVTYKEDFEYVVGRMRAIERNQWITSEMVKPYLSHAKEEAKRCYGRFSLAFQMAGYELEDVEALADIFLLGFIGDESVEHNKEKAEIQMDKIADKTEEALMVKNLANMHLHIRQRLQDAARICTLKSQNFYGNSYKKYYFKGPREDLFMSSEEFLQNYESFGFEPITLKEYTEAKQKAKRSDRDFKGVDGLYYRFLSVLPTQHFEIIDDYQVSDGRTGDIEEWEFNHQATNFKNSSLEDQIKTIESFIEENKRNHSFRRSVRLAKNQLKKLKTML